ncbi:hypothetical protein BaRGS_00006980 [Batillaria attramentaria]|uniref:Enoyl-[acyl-carrier-protein] reductase, mitochondrial n=1 Tax=Batillaria attramentaria TaxID=370345 RepID=A0ABD0LSC8_9CAEN
MLLAPVHPIDLDTINGFTDEHHCLPAVGGCEGVGVVEKIGCGAIDLNNGDWVVSKGFNWGTWQTMAVADAADVMRVPKDIPLLGAATLAGNACTAYRLLKDFVDLKPRDVIIQNGANGAVGQAVMQLAREWGIITVNVVRDRPKIKALSEYLQGRGATHVITDTFLKSSSMQFFMKSLPGTPKLALNCVGGKLNVEMMKYMPFESVLVTYGEVSHEPVVMPANVISNKRVGEKLR